MILSCTKCPEAIEVSEEDPDASLSDLWDHLGTHVPDRMARRELFAEVQRDAGAGPEAGQ